MKRLVSFFLFGWLLIAPALAQPVVPVQMRDADLTTTSTQNLISTLNTFTAPRTLTLPGRGALSAYYIQIADTANAINGANVLTIRMADGGLINGAATLDITNAGSYVFIVPNPSGYFASIIHGGTNPGGTNGQIQFNNAGVFGGFTASGDATVNTLSGAVTLTTVNANVGAFGSTVSCATVTVNAKGLITAASQATCTPAVGSITGFGTGVATALTVNVGSAGAPILFNGAGGTPSSIDLTNGTNLPATSLTGTIDCARMPALTGDTTSSAGSCANVNAKVNGIAYSATAAIDTIPVITTANTTATYTAIPNCTTGVLQYATATHLFSCGAAGSGTVTNVATAGLATGGPITTTGTVTVTAATKSDQETGTSTTTVVTPANQKNNDAAQKSWGSFTGSTGAALTTYNSSISRTGTGLYTITFTTAFATADYSCTIHPVSSSTPGFCQVLTKAAGSMTTNCFNLSAVSTDFTQTDYACSGRQ